MILTKRKSGISTSLIILFQCIYLFVCSYREASKFNDFSCFNATAFFFLNSTTAFTHVFFLFLAPHNHIAAATTMPALFYVFIAAGTFITLSPLEFYKHLYGELICICSTVLKAHNGRSRIPLICCYDYKVTIIILVYSRCSVNMYWVNKWVYLNIHEVCANHCEGFTIKLDRISKKR